MAMLQHIVFVTTIIFGAAIVVIAICKRLRIPPVIGFILTGLGVGPLAAGFLPMGGEVRAISELGVVFLLFMVGLDFTSERLRRLGRTMLVGGSAQALLTLALALALTLTGFISISKAVLGAFIVIQSSTAIALKVFQDRGEIHAPHAEISVGISLFQDVSTVFLLILIPMLGAGHAQAGAGSLLLALRNFLILAAGVTVAYLLMPYVLRLVIGTGIRELIVLLALVLCLGFAGFTEAIGFSLALGSFICGIMLSRSEYHAQIMADTAPFRDVFLSLFFIAIGLNHDWNFALQHFGTIAGLAVMTMLGKSVILYTSTRLLGFPFRTALLTGVGLSNIGEFGFVIMLASLQFGLLTNAQYQTIGSAAIYSMLLTPLFINVAARLSLAAGRTANGSQANPRDAQPARSQVVVVGYGLAGRQLARVLKSALISYTVIENNGRVVQEATQGGEPIMFGDAARLDILERSGVRDAEIIVFLISDPAALRTSIGICRQINPDIFIMSRTRRMSEIEPLLKIGADDVVSEEFETSIELFTSVLTRLHVPRNIIRAQTRVMREDGYEMLRVPAPVQGVSQKLAQVLAAGTTDVFQVMAGQFADGKSLQELDLRRTTGVTVIAVVRGEESLPNPAPEYVLRQNDNLVMMGSHAQIEAAFNYLEGENNA
jgi:CPA2 family monovalent cation:H+ antiporter-2